MANIQMHRAHESLNVETAAEWDVQTRLTISSQAHVYSDVSSVTQIGIYSDSDVYIRYDSSTSDTISANNDLVVPAETLAFLNVPRAVGETIYVHFKQVTSAGTKYLRIIHM
jgi:hypothetical protein